MPAEGDGAAAVKNFTIIRCVCAKFLSISMRIMRRRMTEGLRLYVFACIAGASFRGRTNLL